MHQKKVITQRIYHQKTNVIGVMERITGYFNNLLPKPSIFQVSQKKNSCVLYQSGVGNVYFLKESDQYYTKDQHFMNYAYFNCFVRDCCGRIRVDHGSQNVRVIRQHSAHQPNAFQSPLETTKFRKMLINMATDAKYAHLNADQLLNLIKLELNIAHPKNTADWGKVVRNARYRASASKESRYHSNCMHVIRARFCRCCVTLLLSLPKMAKSPSKDQMRRVLR